MKTSDIIKEYSIHDSRAFNSLTPKMKECAESLFKMLDNHVDDDGNIVCNTEGYIYNPETKVCEPAKEEEDDGTPGSGIGTGTSGESFEDVLKRVVVAAPDVAPISANVRPMQEGGMAGLNRAADNFLKALAG